jgi:hypothetical protein
MGADGISCKHSLCRVARQVLSAVRRNSLGCNSRQVKRTSRGLPPQSAGGSHDHIRTPLYTPLPIEGSIGVLSHALSVDKWSPRKIHKHIVARSLLCDEPSSICRAPRSSISADAKADRRNAANRKSLRRPGHTHRMEKRSQGKFGSWCGVFLLGNSSESGPAGQLQVSMEGTCHGETASVSNRRTARRLR